MYAWKARCLASMESQYNPPLVQKDNNNNNNKMRMIVHS